MKYVLIVVATIVLTALAFFGLAYYYSGKAEALDSLDS
jgi:hypothetical protein